ncbi:MAG: pyruvate ferredoxin oxidoreductase delta subunit [Thermoanaerobacteraceae bacterium]|nr:pyruvate ferredoxin oxidoreductase delta subunit [Thermoanaerobacteraceae bacterium]
MNNCSVYPLSQAVKGAGGKTGNWRTVKPVIDLEKCSGCLLCWIFCPEACIGKNDRSIDYTYCKGCGICETECPKKAIVMVKEEGK